MFTQRFSPLSSAIGDWLIKDLARRGECARVQAHRPYFESLLNEFGLAYSCEPIESSRIPREGPAVVVANHPFGLAEGPILGDLLTRCRPDVKFLANSLLTAIPGLAPYLLPVDPFGGPTAARQNVTSMRQGLKWLEEGHLLVIFPAGEVASFQGPQLGITDPSWHAGLARIIRRSKASVVPAFFHGINSPAFHAAGLLHPRLRTLLLPFEFHNKRGTTIRLSIGSAIPARRLSHLTGDSELIQYLRHRTYLHAGQRARTSKPTAAAARAKIANPSEPAAQREEVAALRPDQQLISANEFDVYIASAQDIPAILQEIGRLREVTFREAGEGSGNARDLDVFDQHYQHLFMWNRVKEEVVGAYRVARTDEVVSRFGPQGLYTSTLFRLRPGFLQSIQPALELGRSFVRKEYQRSYTPLLLLWKAIGSYVVANPRYKTLFGPVSISRDYTTRSQELIVAYAQARRRNVELAGSVRPRRKFASGSSRAQNLRLLGEMLPDLAELSSVVSDLEPDGKGIPVLLHHYLNIGGEVLEFSVDGSFSDVLDGLVVVDLTQTNRRMLERYMGSTGASRFLGHHLALEVAAPG